MTNIPYQPAMTGMGVSHKRILAWKDVLIKIAKSVGDRPDLTVTEWYKLMVGKAYASMPEMREAISAILKFRDIDHGLKVMEKFFTVPTAPAPDTLPRALREVREEWIDSGRIRIQPTNKNEEMTWGELLTLAEGKAGDYNSNIETRFGAILKSRFHSFKWEENVRLQTPNRVVSPDFLCRRIGLTIEIDSLEWHQDRESFTSDRQKARELQLAGYMHLQFSGPELSIPDGMGLAMRDVEIAIKRLAK